MGAKYSSSISYGFIVPSGIEFDKEKYTEFEYISEVIIPRFKLLGCDCTGDLWSGENEATIVYAKDSHSKIGDTAGPRYLEPFDLTSDELWELRYAWMDLGFDSEELRIGWILEFTVS